MRRLRVALIIATLDQAGAEKQVSLLARRMDPARFDVRVIALTRGGPYEAELRQAGIPVTVLGKAFKYDLRVVLQLRQILRDEKIDVAYTWMFTANAFGRAAARWAGTPILVAGEMDTGHKPALHHLIDRRMAAWTDVIVANSEGVREYGRRHGWPEDKVRVIHNGIDLAEISGEPQLEAPLPDVPPGYTVALTTCRLTRQKGLLYLIWAMALLDFAKADVHLWIAGDGPERGRLEEEAGRLLGTASRVKFLGRRNDVPALLRRADLFVLPSLHEGLSNSVLEAMLAGKPVVVSNVAGMSELVDGGGCGLLVEPGSPKSIAAGIYQLMVHPDRRERMAREGQARIRELFSAERFVKTHEDLFAELAERKGIANIES